MSRIDSPRVSDAIRKCLTDESPTVRQAAAVSLGVRRDVAATADLVARLSDSAPAVQRDAATALGKLRDLKAIPSILASLEEEQLERTREHALIYALIDTNAPAETLTGLTAANPNVQRAALIALDQMDAGKLDRSQVTALLASTDLALQRAAIDVIAAHPAWSDEVVAAVGPILAAGNLKSADASSAKSLLLAFAANEQVQTFIGKSFADRSVSRLAKLTLLELVRDASLSVVPDAWAAGVAEQLKTDDSEILDAAVSAAEGVKSVAVDEALLAIARDEKRPVDLRVRAAAAITDGSVCDQQVFALLLTQFSVETPITRRLAAARAIGSAKLSSEQLHALTALLADAGPLELSSLIAVYEGAKDEQLGKKLLTSLAKSSGLTNLSPAAFDRAFVGFSEGVGTAAFAESSICD